MMKDAQQVTGIDIAAGMVEETAREIKRRGISNAQVQVMDAEELKFDPESFDVLLFRGRKPDVPDQSLL